MRYVPGVFDDPAVFETLSKQLDEFDAEAGIDFNRVFYLSTAPEFFPVIVQKLGEFGLDKKEGAEVRVVIEKPFGTNLQEALDLNKEVLEVLDESQVYRIDHYLGKETVQNMLAFRFANGLFEPIWNRNFIDYVQITTSEDLGHRHACRLLRPRRRAARPGPEPHAPAADPSLHGGAGELLRRRGARARRSRCCTRSPRPRPRTCRRWPCGPSTRRGTPRARTCCGYLQEKDVPQDSITETYAAIRLEVDNWRWAGVPIYLRTGKRLARKVTEIAVTLKPVPHLAFDQGDSVGVQPNQIILTMQPNEGVSISIGAKIPGTRMSIRPVNMEFLYGTSFLSQSPEAYERLIMDAMRGDATLFTRDDEVEAQWRICNPIVAAWAETPGPLATYEAGSHGPEEANELLEPGHRWRAI